MPKVVREDIDNLNATLTITLEKSDYQPKFNSELNKYRQQAHMKGFRKGKTPLSVVRKMYGKAVLAEVINELLQKHLFDHLNEEKLDILGQPLPSTDQEEIEFDVKDLNDYVFKFDLGLAPQFEVAGLDQGNEFEKYVVTPDDNMIQEELENVQKRLGERIIPEDGVQEEDVVKFTVKELEGDQAKEGGIESEFSIMVSNIEDSDLKKSVLAAKTGDVLKLDLLKLEKDRDEAYAKRYYLNLEEDNDWAFHNNFEFTITEVSRIQPAELNKELFDNYFGADEVNTVEEAKEKISDNIKAHYNNQAEALLFRDFQDNLMEKNKMDLPDAFLKRWILASNEQANEEIVEKEYDLFAKNLQWTLIKGKIAKQNEVEVSEEELQEGLKNRIRAYFGGSPYANEDMINMMLPRLMEDRQQVEQVHEELISNKLHDIIAEAVNVKDKPIEIDAFNKIIEEAQAEAAAAQAKAVATSVEEE